MVRGVHGASEHEILRRKDARHDFPRPPAILECPARRRYRRTRLVHKCHLPIPWKNLKSVEFVLLGMFTLNIFILASLAE